MSTVASSLGDPRRRHGPRSGRRLPFEGHTYYIDLPSYAGQRRLERDLVHMGGTVDKFLSKQVTHVVTSKSTVSPDRRDIAGSTPEPAILSRGLALLKLSGRIQSPAGVKSGVAARAKQLGVVVVTLADMLSEIGRYVETHAELSHAHPFIAHSTGKTGIRRLRGVFIKIEDDSEMFRPTMQSFQSFPAVVPDSTHDMSPFYDNQHMKAALKRTEITRRSSKSLAVPSTKAVHKKTLRKEGFCECCDVCFDDEQQHRRSAAHQQYAASDDNYASLDAVIGKLSSIENFLSTFHPESADLGCLHSTTCHADKVTVTCCDTAVDPDRLTDDAMYKKAVTEDVNNNDDIDDDDDNMATNNTETVVKTLQVMHFQPDNIADIQRPLCTSVTQRNIAPANETGESTDEYECVTRVAGDTACPVNHGLSSQPCADVDNQCKIKRDIPNCRQADRLTIQEPLDRLTVDDDKVKHATLQERILTNCDVNDMSTSNVYDTAGDTPYDKFSCGMPTDDRNNYRANVTNDDGVCDLTELTLSDVEIYNMLDANFENPDTQRLFINNLTGSSSRTEIDACAEYQSLTHLLEVVDDLQTLCLDGNVITDYLNDTSTSEVDVVTVGGALAQCDQSAVTPCCTRCGHGYTSCACVENRSSNGTVDYDMFPDVLHRQHTYSIPGMHVSPILPVVASSQTDATSVSIDHSARMQSYDSESLRSCWINSFCKPGDCSEDSTSQFQYADIVALRNRPSIGGDICQTTSVAHVAAESNAGTISLADMAVAVPHCQGNDNTSCPGIRTESTSPRKCELQYGDNVETSHWTVAPSGGMSVKLSRVVLTPCMRTDEVTWSVEKCGGCTLRFSVNKQHPSSTAHTNNGVNSASREPTKRRKLF